ncbi:hypothetical protein ACSSS7_006054 [Eimeria intestinalis]
MTAPAQQQLAVPPRDRRTDEVPPLPAPEEITAGSAGAVFAAAEAEEHTGQDSGVSSSTESKRVLLREEASSVERGEDEEEDSEASSASRSLSPIPRRDSNGNIYFRRRKRFRCLSESRDPSLDSAIAEASDESTTERDQSVLVVGPTEAEEEPQQKRPCTLGACKAHASRVCDGDFFARLADALEARKSKLSQTSSGADATH